MKILEKLENVKILKKFNRRRLLISISSFIALILMVSYFSSDSASRYIPTDVVKRGDVVITETESGELRASRNVTIMAPSRRWGGLQIIDMVDEGTVVKKGDTIIQFNTDQVEDVLKTREDRLTSHKENLEKLEAQQASIMGELDADLKTIKNNYELALLSLENMKYESENKRQEAKLQYDNAKLNYDDQLSKMKNQKIINRVDKDNVLLNIEEAKNDLEWEKKMLEDLTIKAPSPGIVVFRERWSWGTYIKLKIGD